MSEPTAMPAATTSAESPGAPAADGASGSALEPTVAGPGRVAASGAGVLAAAAALGAGELAASLAAPLPGPVYAVANRVIDLAPDWFVDLGKTLFGLADKPALVLGTTILALAFGAGVGLIGRRHLRPAMLGIGGFGLVGLAAIAGDAQGSLVGALAVTLVAVTAGCLALRSLLARAVPATASPASAVPSTTVPSTAVPSTAVPSTAEPSTAVPSSAVPSTAVPSSAVAGGAASGRAVLPARFRGSPIDPPVTRRRFLGAAGTVGAAAAVAAAGANALRARSAADEARAAVRLVEAPTGARVSSAVAAAGASPVAATPGITPLVVPNGEFYRIDTALLIPQVDPADWSLRITGMVDRELTFSYDDLLERATTVAPVTLSCVSNEVGGDLVGNAVWQGVPLAELLDEAGLRPDASQIASRSVDGWTCGFPTEAAYDGRTALVAVAMNDEPLPVVHGFPARLVVSGLYGYVSATKWLSTIEATTMDGFDGYWIPRGWSKLGPVKTQSRIDTPRSGVSLAAGTIAVAGVAWAPDTGIERVEIQIDDGPWLEAELGDSLGADAWRQWLVPWQATPGPHTIQVRATDASGYTQTAERSPAAPDGATGWHRIRVEVV